MDRVLYARDPNFNQAFRQMSDVISNEPPAVATTGQTLADGQIEILGIGPAKLATGKVDIHVYFRTKAPPQASYKFQLVVWPEPKAPTDPVPTTAARTGLRATADGTFPTERWRAGDLVRERFTLNLPADWQGNLVVGLIAQESQGPKARPTGAAAPGDPTIAILGLLGSSRP